MWKRCSPTTNTWTDSKYLRPLTFKRGKSNQRLKEKTAEEVINTNTNPRKLGGFRTLSAFPAFQVSKLFETSQLLEKSIILSRSSPET